MNKYFNLFIEFNRKILETEIPKIAFNGKGYCCFIDQTLLIESNKNNSKKLINIINNASFNFCDGSSIAFIVNKLNNTKFSAYNGPEFFNKYIFEKGTHCIIGNKSDVINKFFLKLNKMGCDTSNIYHIKLPFHSIDKFNITNISNEINQVVPNYIWVSLGAPKQEELMYKLLPEINQGVMLGIGAALNWFVGEINDIPRWIVRLRLIWIYRLVTEPKKQLPRVVKIITYLPKIYLNERNSINKHKKT